MKRLVLIPIFLLLALSPACGPVLEMYGAWQKESQEGPEKNRSALKQELEERRVQNARKSRTGEWAEYNDCLNRQSLGDPVLIHLKCRRPE